MGPLGRGASRDGRGSGHHHASGGELLKVSLHVSRALIRPGGAAKDDGFHHCRNVKATAPQLGLVGVDLERQVEASRERWREAALFTSVVYIPLARLTTAQNCVLKVLAR